MADRSLIQYMQGDAYALLIQCFIRNSERSGYILNSEVYDATSDILVKDLVFIAINNNRGSFLLFVSLRRRSCGYLSGMECISSRRQKQFTCGGS